MLCRHCPAGASTLHSMQAVMHNPGAHPSASCMKRGQPACRMLRVPARMPQSAHRQAFLQPAVQATRCSTAVVALMNGSMAPVTTGAASTGHAMHAQRQRLPPSAPAAAASFQCGARTAPNAAAALGSAVAAPVLHRPGAGGPPPARLRAQAAAGGRLAWGGACPGRYTAALCSAVAVHTAQDAGGRSPVTKAQLKAWLREAARQQPGDLQMQKDLGKLQAFINDVLSDEAIASLDPDSQPLEAWGWVEEQKQRQASGDDGRLYSEVTLYVLSQGQKGYSTLRKQRTTRKQLQAMWDKYGYDLAAPVDSKPAQLLTIDTCPDCTGMGSVRLEDGIHLALVMHQPMTFMDLLQDKVTKNTNLAEEVRGFKNNVVAEQENAAAAWALEQIRTEPGAQVFCIKEVAKGVELDGAACSHVSAIIVERKQTFRHSDLEEFITKLDKLRKLIELGAANTELLQGKKLRAYVMAGSWSGSTDEQAAMVRLMNEHHIESVMPDGSGYQISWGCNPHRPGAAASTETKACAQRFLTVRDRVKSAQPAMLHQGQVGQAML